MAPPWEWMRKNMYLHPKQIILFALCFLLAILSILYGR